MRFFLIFLHTVLTTTILNLTPAISKNVSQNMLEPVPGPSVWIEEKWNIKPDRIDDFMKIYREKIYPVLRTTTGYRGYTVVTSVLPKDGIPDMDFAGEQLTLGAPEDLFPAHPGINLKGTRTDHMVHLGSLLRNQFNITIIHHVDNWKSFQSWIPEFQENWRKANNGEDMWDSLQKDFFGEIVINHWDTVYRVVETSFVR